MAARQAPQSAPMWPADWRVLHASFGTETAGSTIWRVRLVGAPGTAVAKVLKPAADAADEARSAILDQVSAGVAVRMSVLYHLLGGNA